MLRISDGGGWCGAWRCGCCCRCVWGEENGEDGEDEEDGEEDDGEDEDDDEDEDDEEDDDDDKDDDEDWSEDDFDSSSTSSSPKLRKARFANPVHALPVKGRPRWFTNT